MLWDPSFGTWQAFGVRANSQMMIVSPELDQGSNLIYGFNDEARASIVELLENLAA